MKNSKPITVDSLVAHYNVRNDTNLSKRVNLNKASVSKWCKNGIPQERQAVFEIISKGKLKANLSKYKSAV